MPLRKNLEQQPITAFIGLANLEVREAEHLLVPVACLRFPLLSYNNSCQVLFVLQWLYHLKTCSEQQVCLLQMQTHWQLVI